jgi:hypothetical protein
LGLLGVGTVHCPFLPLSVLGPLLWSGWRSLSWCLLEMDWFSSYNVLEWSRRDWELLVVSVTVLLVLTQWLRGFPRSVWNIVEQMIAKRQALQHVAELTRKSASESDEEDTLEREMEVLRSRQRPRGKHGSHPILTRPLPTECLSLPAPVAENSTSYKQQKRQVLTGQAGQPPPPAAASSMAIDLQKTKSGTHPARKNVATPTAASTLTDISNSNSTSTSTSNSTSNNSYNSTRATSQRAPISETALLRAVQDWEYQESIERELALQQVGT